MAEDRRRIVKLTLDEASIGWRDADVDHERRVAIFDLIEHNSFRPEGLAEGGDGPFHLRLAVAEGRLVFDIRDDSDRPLRAVMLSLVPFRRVVKDYFDICDSYFQAIKTASPSRIEAIDMGRRGLHNEGSELLRQRLLGKIEIDFDTARRLFTLICALYAKGP
ncbi:MAG: UPF0262 family protein [Alphaproteobacteria bacterium]|nr:UPF0262 family protein [Alphaproteobacteria bacterium]